jgi:hypothetical protein
MLCPEISGDFLICVLGSCVLFGYCFVSGDGAKTFFAFIFLVDLKHGAICQTVLECTLATIFELWVNVLILLHHALQYIKLEIHSSRVPNIESNNSQNVGLEDYNNISDRIFPHFTTPSIKICLG